MPSTEPKQDAVAAYFDQDAPFWNDLYDRTDIFGAIYRLRRNIALQWSARIPKPDGAQALDLGCGAGSASVALALAGWTVDAVDPAPAMVELTRVNAARNSVGDKVFTHVSDAHHLPFTDQTFGLVVALGLLPWLHSPRLALVEMVRVLRPGGYLIISADSNARLHHHLDPLYTPLLTGFRQRARRFLQRLHLAGPRSDRVRPALHWPGEIDTLIASMGLTAVDGRTFGFGPFSFLGRRLIPRRFEVGVHTMLQGLADSGVPILRRSGAQYIVRARKP